MMGYCIYYKQSEPELKFTKREHVIPAGLGGINKLPLGYVSDKVNESFSPIEMEILRNSFISINRNNVGPGKRGTLNVKKVKNPLIRVLKEEEISNENYKLGFVFAGESYIITQLVIDFNDQEEYCTTSYYSTVFDIKNSKQKILDFKKQLIEFLLNTRRNFKLISMPYSTEKHFINIGYHEGKWFAATSHKVINMDVLAWLLLPSLKEKIEYSDPIVQPKLLLQYTYKINMDSILFYFIYVKTAFNALAFLKGSDFVCKEMFDEIRKCILNHVNLSDFIISDMILHKSIEDIIKRIPDKAHFVIIKSTIDSVLAYVSFYGETPVIVRLTNQYKGEALNEAIICDWKQRDEYTLNKLREN